MNSYLCTDPALRAALERCERINTALPGHMRDSTMEMVAAEAVVADRAAFLPSHYQDSLLVDEACRSGSLVEGIEKARAVYTETHNRRALARLDDAYALNGLIPLNNEAVSQLMDAYQRLWTFRTRRELMNRAFRLDGSMPALVAAE